MTGEEAQSKLKRKGQSSMGEKSSIKPQQYADKQPDH